MLKQVLTIITTFTSLLSFAQTQPTYKEMMYDNSYNFYEVCEAAEAYFSNRDIEAKGSGWKGYQRWRNANEYKYYPSGDRSQLDPLFVENAFKDFVQNNPQPKDLYPNGWRELGPLNIDSLTGHYAAGYGRIEDFYVDPGNPDRIFVGSRSGGFWKSLDGGQTWTGGSTDFLFASGVNTIAVDPFNSNHVLINLQNSRNTYTHGIYESFDGGDSWVESDFNPTSVGTGGLGSSFRIFIIAYHPTIQNLVFVGTNRGLYRSSDNLSTWTRQLNNADLTAIEFHPLVDSIMYVLDTYSPNGNRDYVFKSTNTGQGFNQSNPIPNNNGSSGKLSVSPVCPDCVYFASSEGVWKSYDGVNFTFLNNPSESCDGFAVSDVDTSIMIYGYVDLERTIDGGQNFEKITWWSLGSSEHGAGGFQNRYANSQNYVHADLRVAKSVNGVFYVGTDGLFAKSLDNGATWEHLSVGLGVRENYKLGASQSNTYRSISGSQDNGTSIKTEDGWVEFYGADGMEGLIHPLNDDWMMGSVQYGSRRRTLDGGLTQSGVTPSGQGGSGNGAWEAPLVYDPNDHMRIYNFGTEVWVSDDFGENWAYRGLPSSFTGTISHAAIAENNSDIIIIAQGSNIEKSVDAGASFTSIQNNLPNYSIQDIAFHPDNDDIILVCYARYQDDNEKVFMTTDGGNSWINITYNLNNMPIRSLVVDHTPAHNIYLGAELGVYTMPMGGNTWTLYNPNLPNMTVEELEVVNGSNTLKAATWGRGLWEYTLVDRADYPAIMTTRITDMPNFSNPKIGVDQYVTSTISYPSALSAVYVEWSANTPTFGNVIPMSNVSDSTWTSNQALPQLNVGEKMYFKVFAVGTNNDTSETYKFMYTVQAFEYCAMSGTMQYQGNVTLVQMGDIQRVSGKTQPYTDYSSTDSTSVYAGQDEYLTVNLNTDNGNYTYYATAWIDWNKDADFEDAGEIYQLGTVTNNTDAPTDLSPFTIQVPSNAVVGSTMMRVACRYASEPILCTNGFDGEVEDYKIVVLPPPNIAYSVADTDICAGEDVIVSYNGVLTNSMHWTLSQDTNVIEVSPATNPVFTGLEPGVYTLSLYLSINGINFGANQETTITVHEGDSVIVNTTTCNQNLAGTTIDTLLNQYGCDSIITTNTTYFTGINTMINYTTAGILAEQENVSYQWLDCDNNFAPIQGEQGQIFNPTSNGSYAVALIGILCTDTSMCMDITNVSIRDRWDENSFAVYPNPTSGELNLSFETMQEAVQVDILNVIGVRVISQQFEQGDLFKLNISELATGSYFIQVLTGEFNELIEIQKR